MLRMMVLLMGPGTELEGTREWKLSWMEVGEPDEALKKDSDGL